MYHPGQHNASVKRDTFTLKHIFLNATSVAVTVTMSSHTLAFVELPKVLRALRRMRLVIQTNTIKGIVEGHLCFEIAKE